MSTVQAIPDHYGSITPYLYIEECAKAIEFYKEVFGATETERMEMPDGKVGHTEMKFGNSIVMMSSDFPDMNIIGPKALGGSPGAIHVYVENVDEIFAKAIASGAKEIEAPIDKFYGDRGGQFIDPFGHRWSVASHIEDVSDEEMRKRMQALYSEKA